MNRLKLFFFFFVMAFRSIFKKQEALDFLKSANEEKISYINPPATCKTCEDNLLWENYNQAY